MSVVTAQAEAFYREFLTEGVVFTVRDDAGHPVPKAAGGQRAMPFWSKRSRAQRIIDTVPAYSGFEVEEIDGEVWRERWLPGLERDGLAVGLNWSGPKATGYDVAPSEVARNLAARAG